MERWIIFRSNQGSDAHLKQVEKISQVEPYSSVIVKGNVSKNPWIIPHRHAIFSIKDESAEVDCAAFEPTGDLRKIARELIVGDRVEVYGAVHKATVSKPLTINLEKINVLNLVSQSSFENPFCPNCGKRLKSMGKNQGLRCEKCGSKHIDLEKKESIVPRMIKPGLYITSPRSQRHLTKPIRRYGQEKRNASGSRWISEWHFP